MKDFSGLLLVAAAVWLLFLGGCEAVQRATTSYATSGAPIAPAIQTGLQRLQTAPRISVPAALTAPTPAPAAPAPIVVSAPQAPAVPQPAPQAPAAPEPIVLEAAPQATIAPAPTLVPPSPVVIVVTVLPPTPVPSATVIPPTVAPPTPTAYCASDGHLYRDGKPISADMNGGFGCGGGGGGSW